MIDNCPHCPGISTFAIVLDGTTDNALIPFHVAERVDVALAV